MAGKLPDQKKYDDALVALCRAGAVTRLISALIEADEYDKEFYSWHIGEALHLVSDVLSDCYSTMGDTRVQVIGKGAQS